MLLFLDFLRATDRHYRVYKKLQPKLDNGTITESERRALLDALDKMTEERVKLDKRFGTVLGAIARTQTKFLDLLDKNLNKAKKPSSRTKRPTRKA